MRRAIGRSGLMHGAIRDPRGVIEVVEKADASMTGPPTNPERELMQYLIMVRESVNRREGFHYRGVGDFLLQHARLYLPQRLPRPELRGPIRTCFNNAAMAAIHGSRTGCRLHYIEGYAMNLSHRRLNQLQVELSA